MLRERRIAREKDYETNPFEGFGVRGSRCCERSHMERDRRERQCEVRDSGGRGTKGASGTVHGMTRSG